MSSHLQNVLITTAQIIVRKRQFDRITTDFRDQLHWLFVQQRIEFKVCGLAYKWLPQATPTYLAENCVLHPSVISVL